MLDWIAKGTEVVVYSYSRDSRFEYDPIGYGTITNAGKQTFTVRMSRNPDATYRFGLHDAKHQRGKWDSPYYCVPKDSKIHTTLVRESRIRKAEKDVDRAYESWKNTRTTETLINLEQAIAAVKKEM